MRWVRPLHAIPAVVALAGFAWWDYLAALFAAPWLVAIVWVVSRMRAQGISLGESDLPSAAEAARRRLWVS